MAITDSAVTGMKYLGAGHTPKVIEVLLTAIEAESGDIEIEHNEGRAADLVEFTQVSGDAAQLVLWKRGSDDEDNTTITLGTVTATTQATGYVYLHFFGDDSPDVTE